jgi:L-serine dehydratase
MIAKVSQLLSSAEVNIGTMTVTRESKGEKAIMIIEVDERNEAILEQIRALDSIYNASYFG